MNVRYFYGVVASGSRTALCAATARKGRITMTRTEHQHPPRRTIRTPITAVLGGVVLAASVMFGTAVGPAAAETPAEILTNVCSRYVPNPTSSSFTDCSTRVLTDALLNGVNLNYAYLHGAHLTGANLTDATLNDANLNVAHLHNANLTSANLNRATMSGAWLNGANLTDANLTSANLNGTNLTSTNLNRANLNRTTLNRTNLDGADLTDANLTEANLTEANLNGTNLNGTNLTGANLDGTNLTSANLDGATLTGSSLIPANVTVPATSTAGATVTWTTPTMPTGLTFGACDHASGALFPVGATIVTCTVTSLRNRYLTTGSGTFTVTTSPYLEAPSFINPPGWAADRGRRHPVHPLHIHRRRNPRPGSDRHRPTRLARLQSDRCPDRDAPCRR